MTDNNLPSSEDEMFKIVESEPLRRSYNKEGDDFGEARHERVRVRKRKKHKKRRHLALKILSSILLILILAIFSVIGKVYYDARNAINQTYMAGYPTAAMNYSDKKAFSTLLLGTEEQNGKKVLAVSLAVSVNPNSKISTYANIDPMKRLPDGSRLIDSYQKGGTKALQTQMQKIFNLEFNNIVIVNLSGLGDLVESVGGVSVQNPHNFNAGGYSFKQGTVALKTSDETKAYLTLLNAQDQENFSDRQQNVALAVMTKLKRPNASSYQAILNAAGSNIQTTVSFQDSLKIALNYYNALNMQKMNVHSEAIQGSSEQQIPQVELDRVVNAFHETLK